MLGGVDGLHLAATCTVATDRHHTPSRSLLMIGKSPVANIDVDALAEPGHGVGVKIAVIAMPEILALAPPIFSHASE